MATASILITVVAVLALQPLCKSYSAETCWQDASPWTEWRNSSLQCGISIEEDAVDDHVGLLQVELQVDTDTNKAELSNPHQSHLQVQHLKGLGKNDAEEESFLDKAKKPGNTHGEENGFWEAATQNFFGRDDFGSIHGCFVNNSYRKCLLLVLSLPLGVVSGHAPLAVGLRVNRSMEAAMFLQSNTSSFSSSARSARKMGGQEVKRAATSSGIVFLLGFIFVGGIIACMLLEVSSDNPEPDFSSSKKQLLGSPPQSQKQVHQQVSQHNSPVPSGVGINDARTAQRHAPSAGELRPSSPVMPQFGTVATAADQAITNAAQQYLQGTGVVHLGYHQPSAVGGPTGFADTLAGNSPNPTLAPASYTGSSHGMTSPRGLGPGQAPAPYMGSSASTTSPRGLASAQAPAHQGYHETLGVNTNASSTGSVLPSSARVATSPRLGQGQSQPQPANTVTPRGMVVSNQIAGGDTSHPKNHDAFPAAGAPAIASSMIMPTTSIYLTIPRAEIVAIAKSGHAEELQIFSSKGKKMLSGKVASTNDGQQALVISTLGDLPRVHIKQRGRGLTEAFDVLWPRGEAYGTLIHSGDSFATLSYQNRPLMKINKVTDLPRLEMQATKMDGQVIANAGSDGSDSWKLTVGPGVDAVLICACMMGMIIFGGGSQ